MGNISMVEEKLPPGSRFHPRDEELVCDYLMKKISLCESLLDMLIEIDLNNCEPWDNPEKAYVGGKEWYFYSQPDRKYATGLRTNRVTATGPWKATGKDRKIIRKGTVVGMRKSLVFYQGRAPKIRKTNWIMHEFCLESLNSTAPTKVSSGQEDWILCRAFYKNRDQVVAKPSIRINHYENTNSSYLIPPLIDSSSFMAIDQIHNNQHNLLLDHNQYYQGEQVPCISIFPSSHNYQNNIFTPNTKNVDKAEASTSGSSVVDDVLCRYLSTKMEADINLDDMKPCPSSFGEGISSDHDESFLSEVGMLNIWNNY